MNFIKRSFVSMNRQKNQMFILIGAIFLMSTFVAGVLAVNQAMSNTDVALRIMLPAVAILSPDEISFQEEWEETGLWPYRENLTTALLREIGSLPYVRSFNYTVGAHSLYSETLSRVWYQSLFLQTNDPFPNAADQRALSHWFATSLERFALYGVGNPMIWEMDAEIITLINGRVFSEYEMEQAMPVAIVSNSFLSINNFTLGDTFLLDQILFSSIYAEQRYEQYPEYVLDSRTHALEIIGVFDHELPATDVWTNPDINDHLDILNQIFVPATFIESTIHFELETFANPDVLERFAASEHVIDVLDFSHMYFLLYDPIEVPAFLEAASAFIPTHWQISDYSFVYADIAESMALVRSISDGLLIGVTIAMLLVLGLLMLLFLQLRKKEIGIYLALGEFKRKIVSQLLLEALLPTLIGVTLALFVGYLLGGEISTHMMEQHLIAITEDETRVTGGFYEIVGLRHEMTHAEMLDLYEVRMDQTTIVTFYVVVLSIATTSMLIPMLLVLKMNPKAVLLKF